MAGARRALHPRQATAQACFEVISADCKWCLTGTPIQNSAAWRGSSEARTCWACFCKDQVVLRASDVLECLVSGAAAVCRHDFTCRERCDSFAHSGMLLVSWRSQERHLRALRTQKQALTRCLTPMGAEGITASGGRYLRLGALHWLGALRSVRLVQPPPDSRALKA